METEIRFYFSTDSENKIIDKLKKIIGLNIKDAYNLSWDDKYAELCKENNKKIESKVTFDKDMPKTNKKFE